ncbi:8858_t:CDS:2, partial [Scutellospora calospora]
SMKEVPGEGDKFDFESGKAFMNVFNNVPVAENLEAKGYNDRHSPCDVEYVQLARQVALKRVYVVRVADKDG